MTGFQQRLANPQYANWLKAGLCLITLKEGLTTFTETVIKGFHRDILASLPGIAAGAPPTCGICTNNDISYDRRKARWSINCPKCDQIIETLQDEHVFDLTRSALNNTDVSLWCSDAWEIAKVYMNPGQKSTNKSSADSDSSGLVNLILHCKKFHGYIPVADYRIYEQIRDHRNDVMHSNSLELTEIKLGSVIQDIVTVLKALEHWFIATKTQPVLKKVQSALTSIQPGLQGKQSALAKIRSHLKNPRSAVDDCQQVLSVLKQAKQTPSFLKQSKTSQDMFDQAIDYVDHALSDIEQLESPFSQAQFAVQQMQMAETTLNNEMMMVSSQIQLALDQAQNKLTEVQRALTRPQPTCQQVSQAMAAARQAMWVLDQAESAISQTDNSVKQVQTAIQASEPGLSMWHHTQLPLQRAQTKVSQAVLELEKAGQAHWDEAEETEKSLAQAITDMQLILSSLDKEEQGLSTLPVALADVKQTRADLDHEREVLLYQQSSLNNARCDLQQAIEAVTALQQVTEVRDNILELTTHGEMQVLRDKIDALERQSLVMNQQITAIDAKKGRTEEEIAKLKQNATSHGAKLKEITDQYASLQKVVDQIGKDSNTLTAEYQLLATNVKEHALKVTSLQNNVQAIEQGQQEMQQAITTSQERQEKMEMTITRHQEKQHKLNEQMQHKQKANQENLQSLQLELQQAKINSEGIQHKISEEMQQTIATNQEKQQNTIDEKLQQALQASQEKEQAIQEKIQTLKASLEGQLTVNEAHQEATPASQGQQQTLEALIEDNIQTSQKRDQIVREEMQNDLKVIQEGLQPAIDEMQQDVPSKQEGQRTINEDRQQTLTTLTDRVETIHEDLRQSITAIMERQQEMQEAIATNQERLKTTNVESQQGRIVQKRPVIVQLYSSNKREETQSFIREMVLRLDELFYISLLPFNDPEDLMSECCPAIVVLEHSSEQHVLDYPVSCIYDERNIARILLHYERKSNLPSDLSNSRSGAEGFGAVIHMATSPDEVMYQCDMNTKGFEQLVAHIELYSQRARIL